VEKCVWKKQVCNQGLAHSCHDVFKTSFHPLYKASKYKKLHIQNYRHTTQKSTTFKLLHLRMVIWLFGINKALVLVDSPKFSSCLFVSLSSPHGLAVVLSGSFSIVEFFCLKRKINHLQFQDPENQETYGKNGHTRWTNLFPFATHFHHPIFGPISIHSSIQIYLEFNHINLEIWQNHCINVIKGNMSIGDWWLLRC